MNKNIKIAKNLIKIANELIGDYSYYRGVNKKTSTPFQNKNPFKMWITPQYDFAQMYSENGSLFGIELYEQKLNTASLYDLMDLDDSYDENQNIQDAIDGDDQQLIELLKENGYNSISLDDDDNQLICIFDEKLIKSYTKLK